MLINPATPSSNAINGGTWDRTPLQWQPDWVRYDQYHRPVIVNPFRDPLRIVYDVGGAPRILTIPALSTIVTQVAQAGASFTAVVLDTLGQPTSVAVGSFSPSGGNYVEPGVPVVVVYSTETYKPFVPKQIIDVGDDPSVGERKVLLDGATPVWGRWTQTPAGERQFEIHKTQQFPGIDAPAEGPLPGRYQLLASASEPTSGLSTKDVLLILAAAVVATLVLGAIVFIFRAKQDRLHRPTRANRHRDRPPLVEARVTVKVRPGSPTTFETRPCDELDHDHVLAVVPVEVQRSTTVEENHP